MASFDEAPQLVESMTTPDRRRWIGLNLASLFLIVFTSCHRDEPSIVEDLLRDVRCPFAIYWPPRDPQEIVSASVKPLLRGSLALTTKQVGNGVVQADLVVTVTRPSAEPDRQFWNSQLAFADIAWMDKVRVWDADKKWLWPNLPYLLRLPGQERIERYGGMDPGKRVDNDFAAVLVRKYESGGRSETDETRDAPLVSAEWYADGSASPDLYSVVNSATSDTFAIRLGQEGKRTSGRLKIWLIYADFLGALPPRTWPKTSEWAGGILAYFEVDWKISPERGCRGTVRQTRPVDGTGFDWSRWVVRTPGIDEAIAHKRLSDRSR